MHLRALFADDPARAERFSIELPGLFIDYSKNILTDESLGLLIAYAESIDLGASIRALFNGEKINRTEGRAALHTALRSAPDETLLVDGRDLIRDVQAELGKMERLVKAVQDGTARGWTRGKVRHLREYRHRWLRSRPETGRGRTGRLACRPDPLLLHLQYRLSTDCQAQKSIRPETTLFIVSSKSFATPETKTNAATLKAWLRESGCDRIDKHFVAVTANEAAAAADGIARRRCFKIWDWVGGRFSLWSSIGLPIALALGFDNFRALLAGARRMDRHFRQTARGRQRAGHAGLDRLLV